MKDKNWDQKLWQMVTNPFIIGIAALLQMRQLATKLQTGAAVEEVILLQWLIPLAVTIAIAVAVAWWGFRNFWSITQTVLVGLAFTMLAHPVVNAYVTLLAQP